MRAELEAQDANSRTLSFTICAGPAGRGFRRLPVEDIVRELLLAHARPGLHKVYDLHAYEKEKADALKLWHAKLKDIR